MEGISFPITVVSETNFLFTVQVCETVTSISSETIISVL